MHRPNLLHSFFLGGFECSTHLRDDGVRLDLLAATRHDRFAAQDYAAMRERRLFSVRDGLRWHLIEQADGSYDWSSFLPMLQAARDAQLQVIWDLCHYGWPDHLDIWEPRWVERFARFAGAAARLAREQGGIAPLWCAVNEPSFWAWAGGDMGHFSPATRGRGCELKRQLIRATLAAQQAIREVDPAARFVTADPVIHVVAPAPELADEAERARLAQFESWDMLLGRRNPELGGSARELDIVGVNFYSNNQWLVGGGTVLPADPRFKPFHLMLDEVHRRYRRPILIAETGAEGEARSNWLRYVSDEVLQALDLDIPLEGICLYPVLDYPGWTNDRHCETGLLGLPDDHGRRPLCQPLAHQLAYQQARFETLWLEKPARAEAVY